MATWSPALGVAMLSTGLRPQRAPAGAAGALLLLAALQVGTHTINHVADAGAADPAWVGVFDALIACSRA